MHHRRSRIQILSFPSSRLLVSILVLVFTMLTVHKSSGLRCFHCKDHDNHTDANVLPNACRAIAPPTIKVLCPSDTDLCMKTAVDVVTTINGTSKTVEVVRRRCFDNAEKNYSVGCRPMVLSKPFIVTVCFCNGTDYCNRGLTLVSCPTTIMILGIQFVMEIL